MLSARVSRVIARPEGHKLVLLALAQAVLLLAMSAESTIIPNAVFRDEQWWRILLALLVASTVALWLSFPMIVSKSVSRRIVFSTLLLFGPYICLVLAESINAIFSGAAPLLVRTIYLRLFTMLPTMLLIFLAGGGGLDADRGVKFLLRPYFYLALFIAFAGTVAWFLLQSHIVERGDWPPPPGLAEKIDDRGGANVYAMPLYLGFALVGNLDHELLGTFRISGLSAEPNAAALFVTPALLIAPLMFGGRKLLLMGVCATFLTFLFLAFSATNVVGLFIAAGLLALKYVAGGSFWRRIPHVTSILALLSIAYILFGALVLQSGRVEFLRHKTTSSLSAISVRETHETIASTNSVIGRGIFRDFGNEFGRGLEVGLLSTVSFWAQALALIVGGCVLFFSRRTTAMLGLALIYAVVHSMKDPQHVLMWPIYMYLIAAAVLAFAVPSQGVQAPQRAPAPVGANAASLAGDARI